MININSARKAGNLIVFDYNIIAALALSKNRIRIGVSGIIRTVKNIIVNIIGHYSVVFEIIVYIDATAESAIFDFHLSRHSLFA